MKVFAFTVERIGPKEDMFHNDRLARVYEIKRNVPRMIGRVTYTIGRSKGHESEVFGSLINWGFIPKKLYHLSKELYGQGEGYYIPDIEDKGYKIIRME